MKTSTLKSQSGFSLVELMVVVAIIGILAAMSVGQVQKQIAKARQSEAKSSLASLFTSNTAFRSEFNTYTTDFSIMKLEYSGRMRYRTGFNVNAMDDAAVTGFGWAGTNASDADFTTADCGSALLPCTESNETATVTGLVAANTATQTTFRAGAISDIYQDTVEDEWSIDNNKNIVQQQDGIP